MANEPRMVWLDKDGKEVDAPGTTGQSQDYDDAQGVDRRYDETDRRYDDDSSRTDRTLQESLTESGAKPVNVDVESMLQMIRDLESRVATAEAERGIPSDRVAAAWLDLQAHVAARKAASPELPSDAVTDIIKSVDDPVKGNVSSDHVDSLTVEVDELIERCPHQDLGYLRELVRNLKRAVAA